MVNNITRRPNIESVFTPRNKSVNASMYISRPNHEKTLLRSIHGSMHTMLFGESGNGKSWLYKHVFIENNIKYVVANCGNAARHGSLTEEIKLVCLSENHLTKTTLEQTKEASGSAGFAGGKIASKATFSCSITDPLLNAFRAFSNDDNVSVIVIENLEAISGNEKLTDELCNIILLLDDERYAEHNVKLLIVGTPNGVLDFFGHSKNLASISNRVEENPKVSGLTSEQTSKLIEQGLLEKLEVEMSTEDIEKLSKYVYHVTLGIAQRVQEFGVCLAYKLQDNDWVYSSALVLPAGEDWLNKGLRSNYVVVESHMNSKETTVGRRNQVIYAIGKLNKSQFYSSDIEEFIRKEFPDTIPETNMGIGAILSELADSDKPLIKKNEKSVCHTVVDPLYIMCIRLVLVKNKSTGRIQRRTFKTN